MSTMSDIKPDTSNGAAGQHPGEDLPKQVNERSLTPPLSPRRLAAMRIYAIAHGNSLGMPPPVGKTLELIEAELSKAGPTIEEATAAWCTISAIIAEMRQRTMRLVSGALNPAHKARNNPRLLVFQDALEDLAELLDRELPLHPEAAEWWHNRRSTLMPDADEMRSDLRRLDRLVEQIEAEAAMASETPDDATAPKLRAIDKIEGIVNGLRDVASRLQETVIAQRERIVSLQRLKAQRN